MDTRPPMVMPDGSKQGVSASASARPPMVIPTGIKVSSDTVQQQSVITPIHNELQPTISVVHSLPQPTIAGVTTAKTNDKVVPQSKFVGPVMPQPKITGVINADGTPYVPTKQIPQPSDTAGSTTASLLPQTFMTVQKTPDEIAWEDKSKSEILKDLVKSPIKDLIVTPGVRIGQVIAETIKPGSGANKDVSIDIPLLGHYDVAAQKTGIAGAKQIAGQGLAAASWLYAPEKVVGVGRELLNDVAIQSIKDGVNITDSLVRDAFWNTVKKGVAQGAIVGSMANLGSSLQEDKKWTDNAKDFIIGGLFGGALGGATAGAGAGLMIAKNKTAFIQKQLMQELIDRGLTPEHAQNLVSQGGYIGDLLGSIAGDGSGGTIAKLPSQKIESLTPQLNQEGVASYGTSLPQPGNYVKERGFMTSLKENPETQAIFKDVTDNYNVHTNAEDISKVRAMSIMEPDKFQVLVRSSDNSAESTIAKIMYMRDAIKQGNVGEAKAMAEVLSRRGTEMGQAIQAYRTLGSDLGDPAKAMVFAQQAIDKSNKELAPKFEGKVANVERTFQKIHEDVAKKVADELPDIQRKLTPLEKKIEKQTVPVEEQLAERIRVLTKSRKPNPVKDMLNTLLKVANETLPAKAKKPPRNAIDLISEAVKNKDVYKEVWLKAQPLVRERYKNNPEALKLLEDYFNKTLLSGETTHAELPISQSMVNRATQEGMKKTGVDLGKIVREHYTVVDKTGKDLTTKLVKKAGVPSKDAMALSQKIQSRFDELVTARKESALKQIFNERKISSDKSFVDKIIEWSNLGAFDSAKFRQQAAEKLGLTSMSDELAQKIIKQSDFIQQLPADAKYERFKQAQNLLKIISDETPMSKGEILGNIMNTPRALMASFDFSFGFRQGLIQAYRHPMIFAKAFGSQFGMLTEQGFAKAMDLVMKNPDFELGQKTGLAFTDLGSKMTNREENFMSSFAEKIPLLGKGVKLSERAYTGMANKLRMDVFSSLLNDAERIGLNPRQNEYVAEEIANLVNLTTGRGSMGKHEDWAPLLNSMLFSPRLAVSRLTLMNPMYYIKASPFVRQEALKSMLAYASATTTVLGLAKLAGLNVGIDPRSADFGKIRIKDTRVDIMGGFQQYIRMAAQMITGKYISSTTGKEYTLGEGYKPMTRFDIALRQFESKTSPVTSFAIDMLKGTDYNGQSVYTVPGVGKEVLTRFVPMMAGDLVDLYKSDPYLLPLGLLNTVGFSIQTYQPQKPTGFGSGFRINKSSGGKKLKF